jgi:hypothetical protein
MTSKIRACAAKLPEFAGGWRPVERHVSRRHSFGKGGAPEFPSHEPIHRILDVAVTGLTAWYAASA